MVPPVQASQLLQKKLALALGSAPIVEMDDFLAWDDLDLFKSRLQQELIDPLFAGRCASYQVRDQVKDS